MTIARTPWWAWTWPVLAWVILSVTPLASPAGFIAAAAGLALILAVFAAVYHAEVVAHRTGESADFMLGRPGADRTDSYVLGEINVSSVFPIPDEAPAEIARRVADRLREKV